MVDLGGWVRSSNESNIQKNSSTFWQLKNYVTYSGNIGDKHHYTAMVGQECWESSYDFTSVFNSGLPSDEVHNPALGTGTPTINAGFGSSSMASFFTRLTYNYADRYLGTYTIVMTALQTSVPRTVGQASIHWLLPGAFPTKRSLNR